MTGSKEAVLRKLLETQDTYIHELEAKCKAMTAQLLSDQGTTGFQPELSADGRLSGSPGKSNDKILDLAALETS